MTQEGLEQILALKCNLNKGLTDELKEAFPHIVPVNRPEYEFKGIPHPYWISGFASGDSTPGEPGVSSNNKIGKRIRLIFGTHLHIRDKELLIGIGNYFKSSDKSVNVHCSESKKTALLQIKNSSDIENRIIPFFIKEPLRGCKSFDFADFLKVADLLQKKEHLTLEGLAQIEQIVKGMNLDRNFDSSEFP